MLLTHTDPPFKGRWWRGARAALVIGAVSHVVSGGFEGDSYREAYCGGSSGREVTKADLSLRMKNSLAPTHAAMKDVEYQGASQ